MFISIDDENISFEGRTALHGDFRRMTYPLVSASVRFKGTKISAKLFVHEFYFKAFVGIILDGQMKKLGVTGGEQTVVLAENLDDCEHELTFFKPQAGNNVFDLYGFETDGEVLPQRKRDGLKIEVYGDSVSAGEVCEATDFTAALDPDGHEGVFDNSYYSYAAMAARDLNARVQLVCQGGIAVETGTGYYHAPDFVGMDKVYDKATHVTELGLDDNDFDSFCPDIVVVNLGQNDKHIEGKPDADISDEKFRKHWKGAYKRLVGQIRLIRPNAKFILTLSVLEHEEGWDEAVRECAEELGGEEKKFYYLRFRRAGKATPGHPRISEQREMADELVKFIEGISK